MPFNNRVIQSSNSTAALYKLKIRSETALKDYLVLQTSYSLIATEGDKSLELPTPVITISMILPKMGIGLTKGTPIFLKTSNVCVLYLKTKQ